MPCFYSFIIVHDYDILTGVFPCSVFAPCIYYCYLLFLFFPFRHNYVQVEIYGRMKGCEGVVQFYGVTYPPGLDKLCIVTKYAEFGSLSWYLKVEYHKIDWSHKLLMATQISTAIARLHQEGIYHRDLHSGNILVDAVGNAMLTDFGASTVMEQRVARSIDDYALQTITTPEGESKYISTKMPSAEELATSSSIAKEKACTSGKPKDPLIGVMAYIAPERFRNPRAFDARCDIYSLGVLLWELTSGHGAFARVAQDVPLAVSILNGKREQPVEGTPQGYQELYERCWETDPVKRPTLEEVLVTLTKVRESMTPEELAVTRARTSNRTSEDGSSTGNFLRLLVMKALALVFKSRLLEKLLSMVLLSCFFSFLQNRIRL